LSTFSKKATLKFSW